MSLSPRAFRPARASALKSAPIHPAETALTAVLAAWLIFLPWAFGTRDGWAQGTSLGLAALAFLLAVFPRRIPETLEVARPLRLLVRLPLFWLGLAVLGYVAVQAANPAWSFVRNETSWWLEPRDHFAWLPHGIDAPFERMNQWRVLLIWAAPVLAVTAAWLGLTRRRTVQFLAVLLVLNTTAVALLGMLQRFTGTNKIYWHFSVPGEAFGSFFYRNHGAQFLLLGLGLALGLGIRHYLHGEARGARSTPAPVFGFLAVVIAAGLVVSTSRLGAVFGAALVVVLLGVFAGQLSRTGLARRTLPLLAAIVVVGFGGWFLAQVDLSRFFQRFQDLAKGEGEASLHIRVSGAELARDMWTAQPWFGHGAAAYLHVEPHFTPGIPVLPRETMFYGNGHHHVQHFRTRDAHNDHLQLLAEMGLVGAALVYALLAAGLAALTAPARRGHPVVYATLVTVLTLVTLATLDFPFVNPAILGTFALLFPLACRWADLEPAASRG